MAVTDDSAPSSVHRPPLDHLCDMATRDLSCLAWQRQAIGTCCRRGHNGVLCASCDEGWVKAKGLCIPCQQGIDFVKLGLMSMAYVGLTAFFWRKATALKKKQDGPGPPGAVKRP